MDLRSCRGAEGGQLRLQFAKPKAQASKSGSLKPDKRYLKHSRNFRKKEPQSQGMLSLQRILALLVVVGGESFHEGSDLFLEILVPENAPKL